MNAALQEAGQALHDDGDTALWRRHMPDGRSLLERRCTQARPGAAARQRLQHEYQCRDHLDPAWAAVPLALDQTAEQPALQLSDPGGVLLADCIGRPWSTGDFLRVAGALAATLVRLHGSGLLHLDLQAAHWFIGEDGAQAWLTGFGSALPASRVGTGPARPAGRLSHAAPEVCGHMNRLPDARTDLYALGVVLYELLSGELPFTATDPIELVHAHVARLPKPPSAHAPGLDPLLDRLVLRLLAKAPEERYQTAQGVEADLRRCLADWQGQGALGDFTLGESDRAHALRLPDRLYGRDRERALLREVLARVTRRAGTELTLLAGYAGIGKSSLVEDLQRSLPAGAARFAFGKADQYQQGIPYASLGQALQGLVKGVLAEAAPARGRWEAVLRESLGADGQVIADLAPELARLTGPLPALAELSPRDMQARFQAVLRRFLQAFVDPGRPLVLFIDDLQWVDAATLALLDSLLREAPLPGLLLVGAYRNHEVGPDHPLGAWLATVRTDAGRVTEIVLAPLPLEDVVRLVGDTLQCPPADAAELGLRVQETAAGNPFHAVQYLGGLCQQGLLHFDGEWRWDIAALRAHAQANDVVAMMVTKLDRLGEAVRQPLIQLACLGSSATARTLATVCGTSPAALSAALWPAVQSGLVLQLDGEYRFVHDRVQEAAYALVAPADRPATHLAIGRRLRAVAADQGGAEGLAEAPVFEIVHQYRLGAAALNPATDTAECDAVAALNLAAARRARSTTAYPAALAYAETGFALLGPGAMARRHALAYALQLARAESAFLTGQAAIAEALLLELVAQAETPIETAAASRMLVSLYVVGSRYAPAVAQALAGLRRFGIDMPPHPSRERLDTAHAAVLAQLGDRSIESLIELPRADDAEVEAAMDVLAELFAPACFTDENLALLHLCEMVRLSLAHGVTPASAQGFGWFGVMTAHQFGRYREGLRFAKLSQALVERHGFRAVEAKALFAQEIVSTWTQPLSTAIAASRAAFTAGAERGDLAIACFACHHTVNDMLVRSDHLDDIAHEIERGLAFVRRAQFRDVVDELLTQQAFVAALRGAAPGGDALADPAPDFTAERMPTMVFWHHVFEGQRHVLDGQVGAARAALERAAGLLWSAVHIQILNFHLYAALAWAAERPTAPGQAPEPPVAERRRQVLAHLEPLRRWRELTPATFADKATLVEAELARLDGRELDAERRYEQAIGLARAAGCTWAEALANELAARFHAGRGFATMAQAYLRNARYAWMRWGAAGQVQRLDAAHPWLRAEAQAATAGAAVAPVEQLDLGTVVKVTQALAGETDPERLIATLMVTALEHAGAERGLLLLPEAGDMMVRAAAHAGSDGITVEPLNRPPAATDLPRSVLQQVLHTADGVLIDDARLSSVHAGDLGVLQRRPRALMCLPLQKQGRLAGVLYLENSLTAGAFSPGRTAVLKLLAAQAASALENAQLVRALTRENHERRLAEDETERARAAWQESEGRFRRMADSTPDVIWITDLSPERVLYASPSFERIWGHPVDALYRNPHLWTESIHPQDQARIATAFGEWLGSAEPRAWEVEFRVVQPDGAVRWIHERGFFITDDDGRPQRVSGISSDITERRLAEAALRESEERFALAVAGSNDGIWDWDIVSDRMFMSARAQQLYGLASRPDLQTRAEWKAHIRTHPDDLDRQQRLLDDYLAGHSPAFDGEWRVQHPDGSYRWLRIRGLCVRDAEGRPTRMAGSVSDIDGQRRAEAALQRAQRLEAVGTLAGGVAHDFNNILGAILGFGEMSLRHTRAGSRARRDIQSIMSAGERGRALVERILAFSRSGVGERRPVHVEAVVQEALGLLAPSIPGQVLLETQLRAGRAAMMGDPTQVHQLLTNLATNGLQAMPSGGRLQVALAPTALRSPRAATTGTVAPGEYIVLSVQDNGCGIDSAIIERIFDPFFTTKEVGTGTGLGLSLVHGIVTELGGAVDVSSRVGAGSRFTVYLPRCGDADPRPPEARLAAPRGDHQQVLIVDDEEALVRFGCDALSALGYMPVGYTSSQDALAAFQAHPERFDAVVTDSRMPRLSGTALIAEIRALRPALPILLVSGFLGGPAAARAREAGADAVLAKPYSTSELGTALANLLRTPT